MKKLLTKLSAITLVLFTMICCVACGAEKEESFFAAYSGELVESKQLSAQESEAFFTNIKTTNPNYTKLTLEEGVRVWIHDEIDMVSYKISKFKVTLKKIDGVLKAQGSFTTSQVVQGKTRTAESKFYHDGTYLGIETKENGKTDKQKEQLPIENIGNFVNNRNFIAEVTNTIENSLEIESFIEASKNAEANGFASILNKRTGKYCAYTEYYTLSTSVKQVSNDPSTHYTIAFVFDTNYNIIGFQPTSNDGEFCVEATKQEITMPKDFDSWTVRPQA